MDATVLSQRIQSKSAVIDDLQREIRCPICLDTMQDPHSLPCSHSFCRECIEKAIDSTRYSMCPMCKTPAWRRQISRNVTLGSIISACSKVLEAAEVVKTAGNAPDDSGDKGLTPCPQPSAASLLHPSIAPSHSVQRSHILAETLSDVRPQVAAGDKAACADEVDVPSPPTPAPPVAAVPDTPETPLNPHAPLLRPKPVVLDSRLKSPLRVSVSAPPASGTPGPAFRASRASDASKKRLRPQLGLSLAPVEPAPRPKPRSFAAGLSFGASPPSQRPRTQAALLGTGLTKSQREDLVALGRILGVRVDNEFHPSITTHVVSGHMMDEPLKCKRTMKYFMGIACGCWVVSSTWVDACLAARDWVAEGTHEIIDDGTAAHAPRLLRERAERKEAPLLFDRVLYLFPPLGDPNDSSRDVRLLSGCVGGRLLSKEPIGPVCVDDSDADALCRVCGRWDHASCNQDALLDGATMDTIPESAANGIVDPSKDHVGACVCGYDPDFPEKCVAVASRRKRRPNRARPPTDCNGLFTDAVVLSYGDRMDLATALATQERMARPLVDVRWLLACLSKARVLPYEDYMIVATLTECGTTASDSAPHPVADPL